MQIVIDIDGSLDEDVLATMGGTVEEVQATIKKIVAMHVARHRGEEAARQAQLQVVDEVAQAFGVELPITSPAQGRAEERRADRQMRRP